MQDPASKPKNPFSWRLPWKKFDLPAPLAPTAAGGEECGSGAACVTCAGSSTQNQLQTHCTALAPHPVMPPASSTALLTHDIDARAEGFGTGLVAVGLEALDDDLARAQRGSCQIQYHLMHS